MKARNKTTGAERTFTDAHWSVLPGGNKDQWEIVSEFATDKPATTYTPPELMAKKEDVTVVAPVKKEEVKTESEKAPTEEEVLHANIIAMKKKNSKLTNAEIAKSLGTHHTIVKSVLGKAATK